jgi:hypothetical protein
VEVVGVVRPSAREQIVEVACQLELLAVEEMADVHRDTIPGSEPAITESIVMAYLQAVEPVRRHTAASNNSSAVAALLEQLIHPGSDPAPGAENTRRYVRLKASIVVVELRKREAPLVCSLCIHRPTVRQ